MGEKVNPVPSGKGNTRNSSRAKAKTFRPSIFPELLRGGRQVGRSIDLRRPCPGQIHRYHPSNRNRANRESPVSPHILGGGEPTRKVPSRDLLFRSGPLSFDRDHFCSR